ncbi:MAG TPA: anti-sigma factor [Bauldia sp.]|nr:anti-sigma factor [Bauldia sp.]
MTAPDRDEIDALAGEYVLGTLDAGERRAAEARYAADPAFRAAVSAWEKRLQPLADALPEAVPPASTFGRILDRIDDAAPAAGGNVVTLRRTVRRWRIATVIAGAAAAALAGVVVLDRVRPAPQTEFVAVLTAEGSPAAFVASVDVAKGTLSIRRVTDAPPPDKSYELWAVEPDAQPVSLGLVDDGSISKALRYAPQGLTLAVSLEPKGGSPTGKATGPIVFVGTLVPTEE